MSARHHSGLHHCRELRRLVSVEDVIVLAPRAPYRVRRRHREQFYERRRKAREQGRDGQWPQ